MRHGRETDGLPWRGHRLGLPQQRSRQVLPRPGQVRLQRDRGAEMLDRAVEIALAAVDRTEVVVCFGVVRLEAQGFAVGLDGMGGIAAVVVSEAEVEVRLSGAWSERDGLLKLLDRLPCLPPSRKTVP